MAKECAVCKLPISKRLLIEERLQNGASFVSVARDVGLSDWQISNHHKNHLSADAHEDTKAVALLDSDSELDNVGGMIQLAKSTIKQARLKGHLGMVLQGMDNLQKLYALRKELEAKQPDNASSGSSDLQKVICRLPNDERLLFLHLLKKALCIDSGKPVPESTESCIMNFKSEYETDAEPEPKVMQRTRGSLGIVSDEPKECKPDLRYPPLSPRRRSDTPA